MASNDDSWWSWNSWRVKRILIRFLILLALVFIVEPFLFMDSWNLYPEIQSLELYSGKERFTRYCGCIPIWWSTRDTPLSLAIAKVSLADSGEKWVTVNWSGYDVLLFSDDYSYYGASKHVNGLVKLWDRFDFDDPARAKSGKQFLQAMRHGIYGGDFYVTLLADKLKPPEEGRKTTEDKIPDDLADSLRFGSTVSP